MNNASVLVDLAEEILQIDELQRAAPQVGKFESKAGELVFAEIADGADQILVVQPTGVRKAPSDSVTGAGAGDHKVHFREVEQGTVVEIDGELKREKRTDRRVSFQDRVDRFKGPGVGNPLRSLVAEHPVQEVKVVTMLPFVSEPRTGDDVGGGIDLQVSGEQIVQDPGIAIGFEGSPGEGAERRR